MAKISTYPGPSSPSLSDMLIGTDTNDINMTKNFSISDIISLANLSQYVPYTGATGDVDLGVNGLISTRLTVSNNAEINQISAYGNIFYIVDNLVTAPGLQLEFSNNKYYLGDVISNVNGTYILVDDANSRIELSKGVYTSGSEGSAGQVFTSQGSGLPAVWTTPFKASYGSFYDSSTQTTAGITRELMKFGSTALLSGITIVNDVSGDPTEITFSSTGIYNIQFSAQLKKTGGGGATIFYIYFLKDGSIIPDSNTAVTLENNGDLAVASWNFFVDITSLPSYCQIGWYATDANGEIHADPVPVVGLPAIPSAILTVNRIA